MRLTDNHSHTVTRPGDPPIANNNDSGHNSTDGDVQEMEMVDMTTSAASTAAFDRTVESDVVTSSSDANPPPPYDDDDMALDANGHTTISTMPAATMPCVPIAEQAAVVRDLDTGEHKVELKEGDTWYLIDAKWFQKWQEFVAFDGDAPSSRIAPGPIDNRNLLLDPDDQSSLLSHVMELQDYMLAPEAMWRHLHSWYGGGPAIGRSVIRRSYSRTCAVDVHLHIIELVRSSQLSGTTVKLMTSKSAKVRHVRQEGCRAFGIGENDVQLWDYHQRTKSKLLADLDATLADENIIRNQHVLFEERDADGRFPRHVNARDFLTSVNATPGHCGLSNLGNTCFMNSALQCMSATASLRRFFVSRRYEADVNKNNPLGCGGELALVFGELLEALWAGRYHSFAPREFKHQLERFAHQFAGFQQHDSQELLAFLLDGLHEDLNRVKQKPFVETIEGAGRADEVVAEEAWAAHKKRNDSIVVDEFMGQLKSTVECNVCGRISVTFDPFMYLSVPLPQVTTRTISVTVVRRDGSQPMRYAVTVEKDERVDALKRALGALTLIDPQCLVIADVYMYKIHADFEDHVPLANISPRDDIYGYEILPVATPPPPPPVEDEAAAGDESSAVANAPPAFVPPTVPAEPSLPLDASDDPAPPSSPPPALSPPPGEVRTVAQAGFDDEVTVPPHLRRVPSNQRVLDSSDETELAKVAPAKPTTEESGCVIVLVYHRHAHIGYGLFGLPLLLSFPSTPTYLELAHSIYLRTKRTLLPPRGGVADNATSTTALTASSDADSETDLTTSAERSMFPPERIAALAAAAVPPTTIEPEAESDGSTELPPWHEFVDDPAFADVLRDLVLTIPASTYQERRLEFGNGGPLAINTRDQVFAVYHGVTDGRYDVASDRNYPRHTSCEEDTAENTASINLNECLELFMKREQLGADNPWYCSVCGDHQRAYKKFDVWRWPRVLVVHLKRFSFSNIMSSRFVSRGKIDTLVTFPIDTLDLRAHTIGNTSSCTEYQLYAISNHMGGMGGGHYIAHATHTQSVAASEAPWSCFDDSSVHGCDQRSLTSSSAYLLFYRRKDSIESNESEIERAELERRESVANNEAAPSVPATTTDADEIVPSVGAIASYPPGEGADTTGIEDIVGIAAKTPNFVLVPLDEESGNNVAALLPSVPDT